MNPIHSLHLLKLQAFFSVSRTSGTLLVGLLIALFMVSRPAQAVGFEAFFETQDVPLLWINPADGRIVDANPSATDFYGYRREQMRAMRIQDINTFDEEQIREEMIAAKAAGRHYFIFRHQLADGEIRTVEVYSHPYDRQGKQLLLSVVHDITPGRNLDQGMWHYQKRLEELVASKTEEALLQSRRTITFLIVGLVVSVLFAFAMAVLMSKRRIAESESRRFKAIADSALYGSAISDLGGDIIYLNPFFAELHGYTVDELKGKNFMLFHNDDQLPSVESFYQRVLAEGTVAPKEIWHAHRDGHVFPMLMSTRVMRDHDGNPLYFATTALDLSQQYQERKETEQILIEARESAEAASQAKSDFLANMSHEIRTPLNAIIGLSEFQMTSSDLSDDVYEHLQQIHHSGQLLLGIVNDLLDFSCIEEGRVRIVSEPFSLQQVLRQLSTLFALSSSEKGLELILNLPSSIAHTYRGDQLRLTQVLTNLMANAVKFTEKGLVELKITALEQTETAALLRFSLIDSGIGLSDEQQAGLFKAFSQADNSITRRHGGTGLGLVISQRLVRLMGSQKGIELESTPGKGSCFHFDLELPFAREMETSHQPVACNHSPCRALVVDDQSVSRQILRDILQSWDFEVTEATDGEVAVRKVEQSLADHQLYDLILMDWEMPRMDGLAALQCIQNLLFRHGYQENLPSMLMVSAYERSEINLDSVENVFYLPKPVHQSNLFNALESLQKRFALAEHSDRDLRFCQQRVLVVEDNLINQQVVQAQLEQMNLQVVIAHDGREGVDRARDGEVDLILMDIQMPEMDGYQATRVIRGFNPDIPIIALTAAALIEDREKALEVGMNDHLGKPFTGHQLFEHLKPWLKTEPGPWLNALMNKVSHPNTKGGMPANSEKPAQLAARPTESGLLPEIALPPAFSRKLSVLIVDDVPANVKVLASLLKDEYVVQVANRGEKALAIAQSDNPPDLILLDIMMPDIDGYEVCRQLKAHPETNRIPIIFVSALDEVRDEAKGLQLGAVDYITKPYHPDIVKARVRSHMSLKQKTDLLEDMSNIDGLTQVANRRYLDYRLQAEIRRLQRSQSHLSLIMLDIDHFKPFNDNYGHGRGDECLIKVAELLKQVVNRPGDLFARYGGEEFVAILPETDAEGGQQIAEAMRKAVEQAAIPHGFSPTADVVTISLGVVSQRVVSVSGVTLLEQADKALYLAKESGRNRVVIA